MNRFSWLCRVADQQISQPYYRVVCPACYGQNDGGDSLGPGSYWTPRWNGVLAMIGTIFKFYLQTPKTSKMDVKKYFQTKIYKIDRAIMSNAPKEHEWAFSYPSDAGEQVMVQLLAEPELIFNANPRDPEFVSLLDDAMNTEYDIDYSKHGEKWKWNGQEVYLYPNYKERCIDVAKQGIDGWSFEIIRQICDLSQYREFISNAICLIPNDDWTGAVEWFMMDMGWIDDEAA